MQRMTSRKAAVLVCVAALCLPAAAQKRKKAPFYVQPGAAAVQDFVMQPAKQACNNYAFAAAAASVLAEDKIQVEQDLLVEKAFGGDLCVDDVSDMQGMMSVVDGEYLLADGGKATVVSVFNPLITADAVLLGIRNDRPLVLFWKKRAYLVSGASYDEYIGPNNVRNYELKTLTLLDPIAPDKNAVFDRAKNDLGELEGALSFTVTVQEQVEWK